MQIEQEEIDETLVEMTYAWSDIETSVEDNPGHALNGHLAKAFRVEAFEGANDFHDPHTAYSILYDASDPHARESARVVRSASHALDKQIERCVQMIDSRYSHEVRVVPASASVKGLICGRQNEPPPKEFLDVSDIPERKPTGNVPYIEKDGFWLTPIEVPFYDALRDTGAVFAVQPWVQAPEAKYRPDFMVFFDGGIVVVELDGHDSHKTREQRTYDAKRARWFEARKIKVLRWTGSEVHKNPQECVRELLEVIRGSQSRF